ncbi:hypothetical protein LCGC14_3081100 [marine sediment metagenome]|uniref:Uncharacterized protein n=1 Tax=marine sediment metagenome TaxID=412755 RepID=A0A0F8WD80_9ZZZZ
MRYYGIGTLTFSSGTSLDNSTSVDLWNGRTEPTHVPDKVILYTEEDAFTNTITVEVSDDDSNFVALYDSQRGANVTLPAVTVLSVEPMQRHLRVNSNGTEGDGATILVFGLDRRP